MKEPQQIAKVVRAAADAVNCPVTVKIRSGWSPESVNAVEVAKICEQEGAKAIAVHARTRQPVLRRTSRLVGHRQSQAQVGVPVFGNGDVRSGADAVKMLEQTGYDRVMVGRAAEGNPWIFREISAALMGEAYVPPTFAERMATALRHLELAVELYGEKGVLEMRKHVAWYINAGPGAAKQARASTVCEAQEVRELLAEYAGL